MDLRDELIAALAAAHISLPRLEADVILKHAAPGFPEVSPQEEQRARDMLSRRINREPLDKIIGCREFYKSFFIVNQDVLSPRPDTEILVETALSFMPQNKAGYILDLGTGSGCIILSLLRERGQYQGVAVDISAKALRVAQQNAQNLGLSSHMEWINQSWNDSVLLGKKFDIIVSNPPYIPHEDIKDLEPEVREHDPLQALDGGKDGLKCYHEIATLAPLILKKGGYILLEVGHGQDEDVVEIFTAQNLTWIKTVADLAGINRCVVFRK